MNELYWITRFDSICNCATFAYVIGIIAVVISLFILIVGLQEEDSDIRKAGVKLLKVFLPILFVGLIFKIFIPTSKEALLIWGVGGTIDYLQENPTAQKLPDKCIKALDKWVDSWDIEEKDSVE